MDAASFMRSGSIRKSEGTVVEEAREVVVEVLTPNMLAFRVFRLCKQNIQLGMSVIYLGITASEAEAACNLVNVASEEREEICSSVQYMGDVVADAANKDTEAKIESKGKRK